MAKNVKTFKQTKQRIVDIGRIELKLHPDAIRVEIGKGCLICG
jgi:hypothetical protein